MANISGLLGTAGGYKGTGVDAPSNVVTPEQINQSYTQNQTALQGQNDLLTALQAQNGLANQSSVFNQLQGVANGTGPNPAQAQLAQATSANTANQAALMAGQRGAAANPGLIARQAAMQGAANQQQSAGQAAMLQANQSLNAMNQLGGIANTQVANQVGQTNANTAAQQNEQANLLGTNAQQNAVRQSLIQGTAAQQAAIGGGGANALGSMMARGGQVHGYDQGGAVQDQSAFQGPQSKFAQFLQKGQAAPQLTQPDNSGNQALLDAGTKIGQGIKKQKGKQQPQQQPTDSGFEPSNDMPTPNAMPAEGSNDIPFKDGGKVPALVSPGEQYLPPEDVEKVKKGANPMEVGQKVPGKPKVGGAKNSYANDTVKANLDEGGIILPRSVTQAKHPHWEAHKFVSAIMAKNKGKLK